MCDAFLNWNWQRWDISPPVSSQPWFDYKCNYSPAPSSPVSNVIQDVYSDLTKTIMCTFHWYCQRGISITALFRFCSQQQAHLIIETVSQQFGGSSTPCLQRSCRDTDSACGYWSYGWWNVSFGRKKKVTRLPECVHHTCPHKTSVGHGTITVSGVRLGSWQLSVHELKLCFFESLEHKTKTLEGSMLFLLIT